LIYSILDKGDDVSRALAARFREQADRLGLKSDDETPELVVSIGGDGTMLQAFHRFRDQLDTVSFVGVHTGHLGFYADWQKDELEELVRLIAEAKPRIVQYPLVQAEIERPDGKTVHLALNEFTLKSVDGTLVAGVYINGELFEMFRGDGVVISTPTGSTAYNKSVGGAILHPSLEAMQIAEIASINNRVYRTLGSSIVLPKHHCCEIRTEENEPLIFSIDHLVMQVDHVRTIRFRVAEQKISFARFRPFPFWNRVRESFIN